MKRYWWWEDGNSRITERWEYIESKKSVQNNERLHFPASRSVKSNSSLHFNQFRALKLTGPCIFQPLEALKKWLFLLKCNIPTYAHSWNCSWVNHSKWGFCQFGQRSMLILLNHYFAQEIKSHSRAMSVWVIWMSPVLI